MTFQKASKDSKNYESLDRNIFCDLPDEALKVLDQNKIINNFKRGQFIFYAGNTPGGMYCINSGVVKLETQGPTGIGHILRVVKEGGVLGYRSLFADEPYESAAVVHEDAEVCFIPKATIVELMRSYPDIGNRLLTIVAKELRAAEDRLCAQTDKNASERVAMAVLFLRETFPTQNWTRKEIAEWAGTTPETVIRSLAEFESQGMIEQRGRAIIIVDKVSLIRASNIAH